MVREGRFPFPVKIGPRAVAWLTSDIEAWEDKIIKERDALDAERARRREERQAAIERGEAPAPSKRAPRKQPAPDAEATAAE